jgi:predicted glycosyltransferase/broad specificity phosphatase PhoE
MRPALLFYCHHSLGLGHLVRSLTLAEELATRFRVVFLSGGTAPEGHAWPAGVEVVELPPLEVRQDRELASPLGADVETTFAERRSLVVRTFDDVAPSVLLVELFPFGRRRLATEIVPLLDRAARLGRHRPVVATSVRDILVRGRSSQQARDNAAAALAERHLDAVLVHGDPTFAAFEEFFRPNVRWTVPVHHTGFVSPADSAVDTCGARERRVVVTVGGGRVGEYLARAAIAAQQELHADGFEMRVMAGPLAPEDTWQRLSRDAAGVPGLELRRHVDDLVPELCRAAVSISQCGYNTSLDLVRARVPALVVPFVAPKEDEQVERARRLERLGLARLLHPDLADPSRLAAEVRGLAGTVPARPALNLAGARRSTEILAELAERREERLSRRAATGPASDQWLAPLLEALDESSRPATFFFRDDDAGWDDGRLRDLVDVFEAARAPIDLAVIPGALEAPLAHRLSEMWESGSVRLHQHGWRHESHEPDGRACEFGPSRSAAEQRRDIVLGRERLTSLLGPRLDPVFTPPWNRCTADTGRALASLGLTLSREHRATTLHVPGLVELPICVDWLKRRRGQRLPIQAIGALLGEAVRGNGPVGVMLHHAAMGRDDRARLAQLLDLVARHRAAEWRHMRELVGQGRVLLVRHGHTAWNGRRHIGWADVPLDAAGCRQAQEVARALASERVDAVYTSPLMRARDTARPVAEAHGVTPVVLDDLRELRFGDLEGQPRRPDLKVRRNHVHDPLPGGESLADLFCRASRCAARLRCDVEAGRHVVVVGHRRLNTLLLGALEGAASVEEALAMEGYSPGNGSIQDIRLTYAHDGKALTWTRPFYEARG